MSDNIFKRIAMEEARTLYRNQRIFAEDYNPQSRKDVLDRDAQIEEIARSIHNTTKAVRSDLYVFGVSGVGKTYTVRAVLNDALKEWPKKFQYAWVNCKNIRPISEFQVLKEISVQLGKHWGKSKGVGFSTKDIEDWVIHKHKDDLPLLIVFDEVDVLAKESDRLLYSLFENGVSQILLSNVFSWVDRVDPRIKSRSQGNSVTFGRYSIEQLTKILEFIADEGLKKGVMSEEILEKIAEYTTNTFAGDVRKAKYLMSNSVDLAMKEGVKVVTEEHLAEAIPQVEPTSLYDQLKHFAKIEQVVLAGFVCQSINLSDRKYGKGAPATTENVHHFYEKCTELNGLEPVGVAMMKNHLESLEMSGILTHETKSHKSRGRTNVYYSDYSVEDLGRVLMELGIELYGTGLISANEFFRGSK